MISALQLVFSGGIYVPPEILQYTKQTHSRTPSLAALSPADLGLTERQIDVLALMMQGKSNKAICRELDLAEATVKITSRPFSNACRVTNRTEAVLAVTDLGWKLSPLKP